VMMDQLENRTLDSAELDMVIALGGDDSFKYISHFVGSIPLLSINPDPTLSVGSMADWTIEKESCVYELKTLLDLGRYDVEQWNRPEIVLDGEKLPPATSEYYLGLRNDRVKTSKHIIKYRNREYKQKCSGLLIASEAGFSGWFGSSLDSESDMESYGVGEVDKLYFLATELFSPERPHDSEFGDILPGEELVVTSLNDEGGKVVVDSWEEYNFDYGSEAVIKLGNPLIVVEIKE